MNFYIYLFFEKAAFFIWLEQSFRG